jgi:ribosomal protein L29
MGLMQTIAAKDSKIGLLESNIYTDSKIADVYERLNNKIGAMKDEQNAINMQQAVYNGVNTATIECVKNQVAQLMGLTKLVVPNASVCPGWGNVTVTPAAAPATGA